VRRNRVRRSTADALEVDLDPVSDTPNMRKPIARPLKPEKGGAGSRQPDPTREPSHDGRSSSARADQHASGEPNPPRTFDEDRTAEIELNVSTAATDASDAAAADELPHDDATREAAESAARKRAGDSLIWPPPEEELNGWEIVQLEMTGRTLIEPSRPADDAPRAEPASPNGRASGPASGPVTPPPAPRLYSTIPTPPAALPLPNDDGLSIDRSRPVDRLSSLEARPPAARDTVTRDSDTRPSMHISRLTDADENLPETQVIEPLRSEAINVGPAKARGPELPPAAPVRPQPPQIIVQGGRQAPGAAANQPTLPRISARQPTEPRIVVGRPGAVWVSPPHVAEETVDPSAQTRIMPIPQGLARPRVPASMVETLRDNKAPASTTAPSRPDAPRDVRSHPAPHAVDHRQTHDVYDPLATNVWPSPPLGASPAGSTLAGSTLTGSTLTGSTLDGSTLAYPSSLVTGAGAGANESLALTMATGAYPASTTADTLPATRPRTPFWRIALVIIVLIAIAEVAYLLVRTLQPSAATSLQGTLAVDSTPAGAEVSIDGVRRGRTPLRLELAPGNHVVDVGAGASKRSGTVSVTGGAQQSHRVDLTAAPARATASGATAPSATLASIDVRSEPSGARVTIDGVDRGRTPLVVSGLPAGRRQVQVSGPFRPITRQVTLVAGQQASLSVAPSRPTPDEPRAAPSATDSGAAVQAGGASTTDAAAARPAPAGRGWITIESPLVLRVMRNGDYLGTSEDRRIQLPAGTHVIALENESVNFREVRTVEVPANRAVALAVALPQGALNINAAPWAEVFVDNQRIGETPVSQLALPIGPHEILYRHPQFGDRRITVIVKVGTPGRTFVDFTK
jgi:hypothetical protein